MLRLALTAAVAVLLALVIGEFVIAHLAPGITRSPRVWEFDPDLGWANRPGARGRLVSPEYDVEFAINEAGLRGPEVEPAKPDGKRRIAIFGDSFAEGWGVEERATLRAVLEARLLSRWRTPLEVLSFGVAGYGTDQSLLCFRHRGRRFAPDIVVLVVYGNDLWDNANEAGNGGGGRYVPKPRFVLGDDGAAKLVGAPAVRSTAWDAPAVASRAWLVGLAADVARRSHVTSLVLRAWEGSAGPPTAVYYERIYARRPDRATRSAWALTARLIRAFADEARAEGARFVLLYASDAIEVDAAAWAAAAAAAGFGDALDPERPSRELTRLAAELDVSFVDLRARMRADVARGPFFFRERHWNHNGHALAADALTEAIAGDWRPSIATHGSEAR
jgi:hypothetical protein